MIKSFEPLRWAISIVIALGAAEFEPQAQHSDEMPAAKQSFAIPKSLTAEHDELHRALIDATNLSGETGRAAAAVAGALHAHFLTEEEFALPPLGLLAKLSQDRPTSAMRDVLPLTDRLRAEMPQMLEDHKEIVRLLDRLKTAAESERHSDVVHLADRIRLHTQFEEEVLYPAAIVIGDYVRHSTSQH